MSSALRAERLGKRFSHVGPHAPSTFRQFVEGGWRKRERPEEFWALREIDFEVAQGEMLGVIGHNGSGKSTLLRLLGGVMRPDEGRVTAAAPVNGLLELNTGMHPDLTGRENVLVNGVVAGLSKRQVRARFDDIVAFAEIEEFIDAPVRTYSSGMKMRLGFAVAIHVNPSILLIDEVLAVGDMAFQQKCLDRIRLFKERGCAIILISHDLSQVEAMCDRVLWLDHGRTQALGTPGVVVTNYKAAMLSESGRRTPVDRPDLVTSGGIVLRTHENRMGSLEAEIVDVQLVDGQGRHTDRIANGAPLSIRLLLRSATALPAAHISITVCNAVGDTCIDLNTEVDRVAIPEIIGDREMVLHLDRVDLATGDYSISVGLFNPSWAYAFDYHAHAYKLTVTGSASVLGILNPPRQWKAA